MGKKGKEIIEKAIFYHFRTWFVASFGAVITAAPWFITILADGLLMDYSVRLVKSGKNTWGLVFFILGILLMMRVLNIVGYGLNCWGACKLAALLQENILLSYMKQKQSVRKRYTDGDVLSRLMNDCGEDGIEDFYFQGFGLSVIEPLVTGLLGMAVILFVSVKIFLFLLVMAILSGILSAVIAPNVKRKRKQAQMQKGITSETFLNTLKGALSIRLYQKEEEAIQHIKSEYEQLKQSDISLERTKNRLVLANQIIEAVALLGIFVIGICEVRQSNMNYADVLLIYQLNILINNMVNGVARAYAYLMEAEVPCERIFSYLEEETENLGANCQFQDSDGYSIEKDMKQSKEQNNPIVYVDNLSFSYGSKQIFDRFHMSVKKGESVAIIGKSGIGKSTLFQLLLGVYDEYEGSVYLCGKELRKSSLLEWRSQIAIISQKTLLFNQTIIDNVCFGRKEGKQDGVKAKRCLEASGAWEFVSKLPSKENTMIAENGSNFSGGERQRLAIARALYSDRPIWLFDEPTRALDRFSRLRLEKVLQEINGKKTVLAITHDMEFAKKFGSRIHI